MAFRERRSELAQESGTLLSSNLSAAGEENVPDEPGSGSTSCFGPKSGQRGSHSNEEAQAACTQTGMERWWSTLVVDDAVTVGGVGDLYASPDGAASGESGLVADPAYQSLQRPFGLVEPGPSRRPWC